jgi:transmembrane sensor
MKKIFNSDDPAESLIIRFLNGQLSLGEIDELNRWIENSTENRELFRLYQEVWLSSSFFTQDQFDSLKAWQNISHRIRKSLSFRQKYEARIRTRRKLIRFTRMAAVLVAVFAIGAVTSFSFFSRTYNIFGDTLSEISVPQGSRSRIVLPDNSIVWLNAGSKISYSNNYYRGERIVSLEGEGYFDVISNPGKPFIVQTPHLNIRALGTIFNVKAYPDEDAVSTTLVEGIVTIEIPLENDSPLSYSLVPNQNFTYNISHKTIGSEKLAEQITELAEGKEEIDIPDIYTEKDDIRLPGLFLKTNIKPELYTSWKDNVWIIEGAKMADMAVMLERRFNTRIHIYTDELKRYRFTGKIMNETLEQVLDILSLTTPLKYSVGKGFVDWYIDSDRKEDFDLLLF